MNLCLLIFIVCLKFLVSDTADTDWETYQERFSKQYAGREKEIRYAAYLRTDKMIKEFNQRPNVTYTLGHNELSDMMEWEIDMLKGLHLNISESVSVPQTFDDVDRMAIPEAVDLRTSPCMPAVKRQGNCGCCWAFAAALPSEYQHCVKTNNSVLLSEMQMVECSKSNHGCSGGMYTSAWSDVIKAGGHMLSTSYPYTATRGLVGDCKFKKSQTVTKVSAFFSVTKNERSMQAAVLVIGPIAVAISTNSRFNMYKSGIFSDATCSSHPINHGVVIVGYGQNATIPYWIARNSWGASWGMSGYVLMKRGMNICRITSYPAYPVIVNST